MDGKSRKARADDTSDGAHPQRAEGGRFAAGNKLGRGGRPKTSYAAAIRAAVDPAHVVDTLLTIFDDPKTPARERVLIGQMFADRTDGKPIARSITMTGDLDGAMLLSMSPTERMQFLGEIKARRMLGDHSLAGQSSDDDRDPDRDISDDDRDPDRDHQDDE